MKKYQEEFEKWYLAQSIFNTVDKTPSGITTDDIYCKPATRRAWAAWKAGIAQLKKLPDEEGWEDNVWKNCPACGEEYNLPDDLQRCPICGKKGLETI